jgi:dihydropteroate synthase
MVGASRKSFLGAALAAGETPRDTLDREAATTAVTTYAALAGAWGVRVHDVRPNVDAATVARRITDAGERVRTSAPGR